MKVCLCGLAQISQQPTSLCKRFAEEFGFEGQRLEMPCGQVLFYQGHFPYGVYRLCSGVVLLTFDNQIELKVTPQQGQELIIGGCNAFEKTPYACTAKILAPATVEFIPHALVRQWLQPRRVG